MALQASGQISIADIVAEFGGAAPHSLSEYYRGGAYVGSSNTGVPTSGAINLSDFYGAAAITFDSKTITCGTWTPGTKGALPYNGMGTTQYPGANFGSIATPAAKGATIRTCASVSPSAESFLYFAVAGNRTADFFTNIEIRNGVTQVIFLEFSSASWSYDSTTDTTVWIWTGIAASSLLPSSGTRTVIIGY